MRHSFTAMFTLLGLIVAPATTIQAAETTAETVIQQGRVIALDRGRGNCQGCHQFSGAEFHGDIAPPLVAMKQRFPDKVRLRAQIHDATKFNKDSVMPPFGHHLILTEDELNKVVEWVYSL